MIAQRTKALDSLEPYVHQFVSIIIQRKSGEPFEGEYYLLHICQLIDAHIEELSDVIRRKTDSGTEFLSFRGGVPKMDVEKNKIAGKHLWCGDRHVPSSDFCSGDLHDLMKKNGLKDLRFQHL